MFVILVRNPQNDKVVLITEGGEFDVAATFVTENEAEKVARHIPVCRAWPWRIVEVP